MTLLTFRSSHSAPTALALHRCRLRVDTVRFSVHNLTNTPACKLKLRDSFHNQPF